MSRQQWFASQQTKAERFSDMENHLSSQGERLSDKTDDPEAKNYDEATEIFFNGVKLARAGDFGAASPQIACAYLLNSRSINFAMTLPQDLDVVKKNKILDYELMGKLAQSDPHSFSSSVLTIMLGHYLGSNPEHGQMFIATAMMTIEKLVEYLHENPHVENPENGILGGCFTRKALLRNRSAFHMAMGNHKKAIKDLTKALKIDEFYTEARESRACVWGGGRLKDDKTIHGEFKRVVNEVHEDNRGIEVSYGWLALTTLNDPSLGSIEDAKEYYDKCLKATIRRDELYKKRSIDQLPDILQVVHKRFQEHPRALDLHRDLHDIIQGMRDTSMQKNKHVCVKCGASRNPDGGAVMKCSRCKNVSYCSRECQKADWKNHKAFCKMIKNTPKSTASTKSNESSSKNDEKPSAPEDNVAKERLSEWDGNVKAAKRIELELGHIYQKHGKGFAKWWDEMTFNEKKELLLDLTHSTIPLETPSPDEIRDELSAGPNQVISRALFEYNVNNLCRSCKCTGSCKHYFNGMLLHEIDSWVNSTDEKEYEDIQLCSHMKDSGIFPDIFGGRVAIVAPSNNGETIGDPVVFTDEAPAETIQEYKGYMKQGLVYDASAVHYATSRKIFSLCLLIKLFDKYQYKIRRQPSINPMEKLMGCGHCRRSCQVQSAKKCLTCKVAWFCCEGCMVGADHKRCPQNQECDVKAIFR